MIRGSVRLMTGRISTTDEIDHRREEDIAALLLPQKPENVVLDRLIMTRAATMNHPSLSRVCDKDRPLHVNAKGNQVPFQNCVAKGLLRLSLGEDVEARHQ